MSESSAFANYSNTSQMLKNAVDNSGITTEQITDDKANFEQQFLIGASLMAKGKATEKLVGLFKKSKNIKSLAGKSEEAINKLARSAQERAKGLSKELINKVTGVEPETTLTEPETTLTEPIDLAPLQTEQQTAETARDAANTARDQAQTAKDTGDLEVTRTSDNLKAAQKAVDDDDGVADLERDAGAAKRLVKGNKAAQKVAEDQVDKSPEQEIVKMSDGGLRPKTSEEYLQRVKELEDARNDTNDSIEASDAADKALVRGRVASAEKQSALEKANTEKVQAEMDQEDLSTELAARETEASSRETAANEAKAATDAARQSNVVRPTPEATPEATPELAAGESPNALVTAVRDRTLENPSIDNEVSAATKAARDAERLSKLERDAKIAKDAEEGATASEAGDGPVGFLLAAAAAVATQIIGRRIKAHENINAGGVGAGIVPRLNYSSTIGA